MRGEPVLHVLLDRGDEVRVTGAYVENGMRSQLDLEATTSPELTVLVTGGTPPTPQLVTPAELADPDTAESWEGVLVSLEDAIISDMTPLDGQFVVTESTFSWDVTIDSALFEAPELLAGDLTVGEPFDLR